MSLNNKVACPLDCFDACEAVYENSNFRGSKEHKVTNGKMCVNFANLLKEDFLVNPYFKNEKISLNKSLEILVEKLKSTNPKKTLYYKGAGNLGIMQSAPKTFFAKYGSVLTQGSLCDGAGDVGLTLGRGRNVNPPIQKLIDSDVIICWGRNFSVTSPHMYNLVKDKTFITIDPLRTSIAKKSELHIQLNPKTDYELALLFSKYLSENNLEDKEFIEKYSSGVKEFLNIVNKKDIKSYLQTIGITNLELEKFFEIIKNKKVSIMVGIGIQKYFEGSQIIRTIDSFAAYLGVHNKDAGGLWYLADSAYGYDKPLKASPLKKVDLPEVDFGEYELVFIQGANPVVSAPNTKRVVDGLKKSFVVFYGTVLNDTSIYADLIIPSSDFLSKKDLRLSYGHELKTFSNAVKTKNENTITEYELTSYLNDAFSFEKLDKEESILDYYINHKVKDSSFIDNFKFIEDIKIKNLYEDKKSSQFYLVMAKRKQNLNSQFKSDDKLYLHPNSGFKEGSFVKVSSPYGEANFIVALSEDIKDNSCLAYAGNKKANYLNTYKSDEFSSSAIFQEVLVNIELS
ncbi:molybdopterin-dependent oxidoreductase [Arcobacter sp.]|uniref:molybdopterin-dependent oxidoreductase n=1 Tax=Arcobacter sp. TaxID=1872629 RepID=UPI003D146D22